MNRNIEEQLRYDREVNGFSYRKLGQKYGAHHTTIRRRLMSKKKPTAPPKVLPAAEEAMPEDKALLQEELRKARLTIGLQAAIIEVASKELGFDVRKKRGARRSE